MIDSQCYGRCDAWPGTSERPLNVMVVDSIPIEGNQIFAFPCSDNSAKRGVVPPLITQCPQVWGSPYSTTCRIQREAKKQNVYYIFMNIQMRRIFMKIYNIKCYSYTRTNSFFLHIYI